MFTANDTVNAGARAKLPFDTLKDFAPVGKIGHATLILVANPELPAKTLQEVITLTVFVPFAVLYMKAPLKLDYLWAALCMVGAVYFMFRSG